MPTALDTKMRPLAAQLVNDFGALATFHVAASQTYNPAVGSVEEATPTDYQKRVTPPSPFHRRQQPGELTRDADVTVGLPAIDLEFTPVESMRVTLDGQSYLIVGLEPIYSGELVALYMLHLKGGQ